MEDSMKFIARMSFVVFVMCCLSACYHVSQDIAQNQEEPPYICWFNSAKVADEYVEKIDPTIEFSPLTEKLMKELGVKSPLESYPGFEKWIVTFNEIPGDPPYSLQGKRCVQSDPEGFAVVSGVPNSFELLEAKIFGNPVRIPICSVGYLPGEKVTWRLVSKDKDVFKEIVFYPRPIFIKKKSGEVLARACLQCCSLDNAMYEINVCGIGTEEKCLYTCYSGDEMMEPTVFQGPVSMFNLPGVIGRDGGIGYMEFRLEDGSLYQIELPWGSELLEYVKGNK